MATPKKHVPQLPAKRTDKDEQEGAAQQGNARPTTDKEKQAKVKAILSDVGWSSECVNRLLREILAIFGYEVEA